MPASEHVSRPDNTEDGSSGQAARPSVFLAAGEASGDWAGALLAHALHQRKPDLILRGIGGPRMAAAGVALIADSSDWGAIGVFEAARKAPRAWRALRTARAHLQALTPSGIVLIDCGAFNIPLARWAQHRRIPMLYYLPPGSWSRSLRSPELPRLVDIIATPFEWSADLLAGGRARVEWVGHPAVEVARPSRPPADAWRLYELDPAQPVVALAPGSREQEMRYVLPVLARAAQVLARDREGIQFLVPVAQGVDKERVRQAFGSLEPGTRLLGGMDYNALQLAGAAAVCSGTATLEFACLRVPMVVVYRASRVTTLQFRLLRGLIRRQRWAAMPNIIANHQVVTELLGSAATPRAVADELSALLAGSVRSQRTRSDLDEVVRDLGPARATRRTAELVLELIR